MTVLEIYLETLTNFFEILHPPLQTFIHFLRLCFCIKAPEYEYIFLKYSRNLIILGMF